MRFSFYFIFTFLSLFSIAQIKNVTLLDNWDDNSLVTTYDGESVFNECWGFVQNGEEYAVIGSTAGTHFFKITKANKLKLVFFKQGKSFGDEIVHRDYHTHNGFLYEVADEGLSTLRIYDLQYLPDSAHVIYDSDEFIIRSHNIFIDASSNLLYSCGSTSSLAITPLRVLSIADPYHPTFVSDYNYVNYVHDVFVRNDTAYLDVPGEGLIVLDFSTPTMPLPLGSLAHYSDQGYTHSGWLSENGEIYVLCDENPSKRFKICDVSDMGNIEELAATKPETYINTLPHNVIIKDNLAYFSYYNDGLQIYDISKPKEPKRIAYYDTYDGSNDNFYRGAWGVYPLLPSGRILISDRKNGLFLLKHTPPPNIHPPNKDDYGIYPNPAHGIVYFYYNQRVNYSYELTIYDANGKEIKKYKGHEDFLKLDLSSYSQGNYYYRFYSKENDKELTGKFIKLE